MPLTHLRKSGLEPTGDHRKQSLRSLLIVRHLANEDTRLSRGSQSLDVVFERWPTREAVLPRNDELRLVQRRTAGLAVARILSSLRVARVMGAEACNGRLVAGSCGSDEFARELLLLFEIGGRRECPRRWREVGHAKPPSRVARRSRWRAERGCR